MEPLPRTKRTRSLIGLLILFIIGVPLLTMYSAGYRINFDDFKFVETGGIYIHSDISNTRVFLDDEFSKNSGAIFRNTLIQNLAADQTYSVRVEKDEYYPYYKDLYIYPNLVTEVAVLMLPFEIPFEMIPETLPIATTTTQRASTTPNAEYDSVSLLFTENVNNSIAPTLEVEIPTPFNSRASSTTVTLTNNVPLLPDAILQLGVENIDTKELLRERDSVVAWLEDGNVHVMWSGDDQAPYYFCDIRGCRDKIIVSIDTDIDYYEFYPSRSDALVIATDNDIFALEIDDRSQPNMQPIFNSELEPEFRLLGDTIYIRDGEELYKAQI